MLSNRKKCIPQQSCDASIAVVRWTGVGRDDGRCTPVDTATQPRMPGVAVASKHALSCWFPTKPFLGPQDGNVGRQWPVSPASPPDAHSMPCLSCGATAPRPATVHAILCAVTASPEVLPASDSTLGAAERREQADGATQSAPRPQLGLQGPRVPSARFRFLYHPTGPAVACGGVYWRPAQSDKTTVNLGKETSHG